MNNDFFRFPHTPHIAWLADAVPRDDKLLSSQEVEALLQHELIIEEKLDGANLGISLSSTGELRVQNRGQYLIEPYSGQFARLPAWLGQHRSALLANLDASLILFGEWCAAKHSLDYPSLPDWFLLFDVYDRHQQKFWSTTRRNVLAKTLAISVVPKLAQMQFTLAKLKTLLATHSSAYRQGELEGLVIRQESIDWCEARAKLVRADFTQTISEHWRRKAIEWNRVQTNDLWR